MSDDCAKGTVRIPCDRGDPDGSSFAESPIRNAVGEHYPTTDAYGLNPTLLCSIPRSMLDCEQNSRSGFSTCLPNQSGEYRLLDPSSSISSLKRFTAFMLDLDSVKVNPDFLLRFGVNQLGVDRLQEDFVVAVLQIPVD